MMQSFEAFRRLGAIDVTAFLGEWPFRYSARASAADMGAYADRLGLRGLCVSHIASVFGHDTRTGNVQLFAAAAADRRLWPFAILNPAEAGWERELEWASAAGARGVRLLPGYHGYALGDGRVARLVEAMRRYGLPLAVSVRLQDERLQHPRYQADAVPLHALAELIGNVHGHPLLISGLRDTEWEAVLRFLPAGSRKDHVICDLWYVNGPLAVVAALCRRGHAGTFAYGSGAPLQTAEATALQLAAADVREADREALCRGNAERYLEVR